MAPGVVPARPATVELSERARRRLARALVAGWLASTLAAFWHFEGRFLSPIDRPAGLKAPAAGQRVPALMLQPSGASAFALGDGVPTLLHAWDPDCACNRLNAPYVAGLARTYGPRGVRFVALREGRAGAGQPPFPVVADPDGAIARALGLYATPAACLVDGRGRLRYAGTYMAGVFCASQAQDPVGQALAGMLANRPAPTAPALAFGCAITE